MRTSTLATGAAAMLFLVAAPAVSQAGWASRISGTTEVVPTQSLVRIAPLNENVRVRTRADKVQGMPPYQASANTPYAPPPVIADPASAATEPVYFKTVVGH